MIFVSLYVSFSHILQGKSYCDATHVMYFIQSAFIYNAMTFKKHMNFSNKFSHNERLKNDKRWEHCQHISTEVLYLEKGNMTYFTECLCTVL